MNEKVIENMSARGDAVSKYGCKNSDAIRFKQEIDDIRPAFFRDIDRIIHSLSYTRYIDKTQVFSFKENDNITKRIIHVQLVSKIARTIGRALNLNEDLIESAALGHDLGHVPFGHPGEYILNDLSLEHNEGYFNHNIQSVRQLMYLENNGSGSNLTIQTLDAIMCHNGEFVENEYSPKIKSKDEFLSQYESSYREKQITNSFVPMTLEGCVVRISDVIGYLGRDIEDAVNLGVFNVQKIPNNIKSVLGVTNKEIINTIVTDIINNSLDKPYIKLSNDIYSAIKELKEFNYKNIYSKAYTDEERNEMKKKFYGLFNMLLADLNDNNKNSRINKDYLNEMKDTYLKQTSNERKVIDYIAGMTDDYFIRIYNEVCRGVI